MFRLPLFLRRFLLTLKKHFGHWDPPKVEITITLLLAMFFFGFSQIPMDLHYVQFYWPPPTTPQDGWMFVINGDSITVPFNQVDIVEGEYHCFIDTVNENRFQYLIEYNVKVFGLVAGQLSSTSFDFRFMFLPGDFNEDNAVNGADLSTFPPPNGPLGKTGVDYREFHDLTRDGNVFGNDIYEFSKFFGRTYTPSN